MKSFFGSSFGRLIVVGALGGALSLLVSCGSDKKDEDTSTGSGTINFDNDVKPILAEKCATAGCHGGSASPGKTTFESADLFKASGSKAAIENGSMPKSPTTWTDAQKQKVLDYLNGK